MAIRSLGNAPAIAPRESDRQSPTTQPVATTPPAVATTRLPVPAEVQAGSRARVAGDTARLRETLGATVPSRAAPGDDVATVRAFMQSPGSIRSSAVANTRGSPPALSEVPTFGATANETHTLTNAQRQQIAISFDTENATGAGHYSPFDTSDPAQLRRVDTFSFSVNDREYTQDTPNARRIAGELAQTLVASGKLSETSANLVANLNLIAQP